MIKDDLFSLKDEQYQVFQSSLIPTIPKDTVIGVRTPILRKYAKDLSNEVRDSFMQELPHQYYEENILHAICLSELKDYDLFMKEIERFLPYIDNWAVCDIIKPKVVQKDKKDFIQYIKKWIDSNEVYTIRFGIDMLMTYYLDEDYRKTYLKYTLKVKSSDYYVKMVVAWFYATALAKHYEDTLEILEEKKLPKWVHNKTIQKAIESYRITFEQKEYLKSLKIK